MFYTMRFYTPYHWNLKSCPVTFLAQPVCILSRGMPEGVKKKKIQPPEGILTLLHCWGAFWFNLFGSGFFCFLFVFLVFLFLTLLFFYFPLLGVTWQPLLSEVVTLSDGCPAATVCCCLSLFGEDVLWLFSTKGLTIHDWLGMSTLCRQMACGG